jgi:hypothetical protein
VTATETPAAALLLQQKTRKAFPVPVAPSNVVSTNSNDDTLAYGTGECMVNCRVVETSEFS